MSPRSPQPRDKRASQIRAEQIRDDLRHIRDTWHEQPITDHSLRRDSTILRRLLIDGGGGLLRAHRKELGHKGDIKVAAVDLARQIQGMDRKRIRFATAGGGTHQGVKVEAAFDYAGVMTGEELRQQYERAVTPDGQSRLIRTMSLTHYLEATCIIVNGRSVDRRSLIQFLNNRYGGTHWDTSREHDRPAVAAQFSALDELMGDGDDAPAPYTVADKHAVWFEFLSIGQAIASSPDICELID